MKKSIKYLLTKGALIFFFTLGKILNKHLLIGLSKLLGAIIYFLPNKRKFTSLKNLKIAFGEDYSDSELKKILREFSKELSLVTLHISRIISRRLPLKPWAEVQGIENLENALNKGNGVIALSGHFGNFPVMIAWLAEQGYPVAVLYKEGKYFPRNFLFNLISSYKIHPIPFRSDREVPLEIIRALSRGMIVFMLSDQARPGVYAHFFGQLTQCQKGPYVISKRKSSPIVPIFIVRNGEKYKIIIYPELKWSNNNSERSVSDEEIIPLVEKYNSILESLIRQYPTQYFWFHRRFKNVKSR